MVWFIRTKEKAAKAMEETRGMLRGYPVHSVNLEQLGEHLVRRESVVVGRIGPFDVLLTARQLPHPSLLSRGRGWNRSLDCFLPPVEPKYQYNIEVSTVHSGDYGCYHTARSTKSFNDLHDLLSWLEGR